MARPRAHSFTPLISTFAGDHWRKMSEDIFTHVLPAGESAPEKAEFRIRLSVHSALADDVLRSAVPIIVKAGCPFKVIANTALLELVWSQSSAGESAGDFMTIYPASQELFEDLTTQLQSATQGIKSSSMPMAVAEADGRKALTPDDPWPGRDSFLPDEHAYFYGREEERLEMAQRLERGTVTVVLGQAGVGKTSLVRAGLQPLFDRMGLAPVYLHLQCAGAVHPLQQVRDEINRVLRERQINGPPFGEGQSLHEYFNRRETGWITADGKPVLPALIFDQFEDFFTFDSDDPAAGRQFEAFWTQLANMIENRGPEAIGRNQRLSSDARTERPGFKVVIGLRQDYLPQLLKRGGQMPSIARNHFFLKPLNGKKAAEVVLGPGRHILDPANPDSLAEQIIRRVACETTPLSVKTLEDGGASEPLENLVVEPALLSFFCQQLNEARTRSGGPKPGTGLITAELVESEAGRIFAGSLQGNGEARQVASDMQTETAGLREEQGLEAKAHAEQTTELRPREPSLAGTAGHNLEDIVQSTDKAPGAVMPTQTQATDTKEDAGPEVQEVPSQMVEVPTRAPLPALANSHILEEFPQRSDAARDSAPVTELQVAAPKPDQLPDIHQQFQETHELPPKEPLLAQIETPAVETNAQNDGTAQVLSPAPQRQSAELGAHHVAAVGGFPKPALEPVQITPLPAQAGGRRIGRLKLVAYSLGLLLTVILAALGALYLQELQEQQTEVELQEYISHLAAVKNTFKSANSKLTLAESNIALEQSNILALAERTRREELEAQNAKEQNLKLAGEQTNYQSRIALLNREKAQAEARLAQWQGLVDGLTNQIATLHQQNDESNKREDEWNKQRQELRARNDALAVTNFGTILGFIANLLPGNLLTNASIVAENRVTNSKAMAESTAAATMESFPAKLPVAPADDTKSFARRQVAVLLTEGQCLYAEYGTQFRALQVHDVVYEGAVIRTDKGSWCDLFLRRTGTTVRLAPESEMKITKLSEASENGVPVLDTLLELRNGRIFTVVRALAPGNTLEISDAAGHSVIEGGGLGCYMITAPGPEAGDKLLLTPLRIVGRKGSSVVAPGQSYGPKDAVTLSLVPSYWEKMLIQLDELEAETDKAIAEPAPREPTTKN
jgi:hypothetical protein